MDSSNLGSVKVLYVSHFLNQSLDSQIAVTTELKQIIKKATKYFFKNSLVV